MVLSADLRRNIINFLQSLPNINSEDGRLALIESAVLDEKLTAQIRFDQALALFCQRLVTVLIGYGSLQDGRDALEAVLDAAKSWVGLTRAEECDRFIAAWRANRQQPIPITASEASIKPATRRKSGTRTTRMTPEASISPNEPLDKPAAQAAQPLIPFANREQAWQRIVMRPEGQYYLLEGPTGYGKTAFLKKILADLESRNWLCAYVSVKEAATLFETTKQIAEQLNLTPNWYQNAQLTGLELGKSIAQLQQHQSAAGFCLLLDVDHEQPTYAKSFFKNMVERFVPSIYDGLIHHSAYFRTTQASYRTVFAGRDLARTQQRFKKRYKFNTIQLSNFTYAMIQHLCTEFFSEKQERDTFAAHLLFYSGGHPRTVNRILTEYLKVGFPPAYFYLYHHHKIKAIVLQETKAVRDDIDSEWRSTLETLCLYRRFDHPVLRRLIERGMIQDNRYEDEYDLAIDLKLSHQVKWSDRNRRYLINDLTGKMLSIWLRQSSSQDQYKTSCQQAKRICEKRLQESYEYRAQWAVDALFEYLQCNVTDINDASNRKVIANYFFKVELPKILAKLIEGRDSRAEYYPLLGVLEEDAEFRFTLNYSLRTQHYTDEPYQTMLESINHFFAYQRQASRRIR